MSYRYLATETFWRNFYDLSSAQKESTRKAWHIFRRDPFDPRLGTHKIHRLSAIMGVLSTPWWWKVICEWSSTWREN